LEGSSGSRAEALEALWGKAKTMNLSECPKWNNCNAALCPLGWADGTAGHHLPGEKICSLMLELAKEGGAQRVRTVVSDEVAAQIEQVLPAITVAYPEIGKRIAKAGETPSRIESARERFAAARAPKVLETRVCA
jgi:hypothetical protein